MDSHHCILRDQLLQFVQTCTRCSSQDDEVEATEESQPSGVQEQLSSTATPRIFMFADATNESGSDEWKPLCAPALPAICVETMRVRPDARFFIAVPCRVSYGIYSNSFSRKSLRNVQFAFWDESNYDEENIQLARRRFEVDKFDLVIDTHKRLFHRHIRIAEELRIRDAPIVVTGAISKFVMEEVERHDKVFILQQ